MALRDGEYVIQYMAIENPEEPEFFEQWTCLGQYHDSIGTYHGSVYNYEYSKILLDNDEVTRNADNIEYQTFLHPGYQRNGPWTMGASSKYYSTYFDPVADVTGMTCTGIRRIGEGSTGYFNFNEGDFIDVKVGFRVYADDNDTQARIAKDYDFISFQLLGAQALLSSAVLATAAFLLT